MAKGTECLNDGEMAYDNSRIEPKRSHQWFMDGPEVELFPNKKQAVEMPNNNLFSGMLNSNLAPWGGSPSFQSFSGHLNERLFDSETARSGNFDDRNTSSVGTEKMNLGRKVNEDRFGSDSSFSLSMSNTLEDPRSGLAYGGFRKVKVSEVKDSENLMSVSVGHCYNRGDDCTMSTAHAYNKADDNAISMGLTYNKGDENFLFVGGAFDRADSTFMSMGQPFNKADESISIGHTYNENNSTMSTVQTYSKGDKSVISVCQTYNEIDKSTLSNGHIYSKGLETTVSINHAYNKSDSNMSSIGHSYYNKGESTIISFGGCDDDDTNTPGGLLSSYELLVGQSSVPKSESNELVKSSADVLLNTSHVTVSGIENVSMKKDDQKMNKKVPANNFPSNVRSLLSTGMLDGVPVKYIAWSREVNPCSYVFIF